MLLFNCAIHTVYTYISFHFNFIFCKNNNNYYTYAVQGIIFTTFPSNSLVITNYLPIASSVPYFSPFTASIDTFRKNFR